MTLVVVLRDPRWPEIAGVCCWRAGVRAAFEAAGARVDEVPVAGVPPWDPPAPPPRLAWLPPVVRRPLARAYRALRTRGGPPRARPAGPLPATVGAATLLVAEGPQVAAAAIRAGAPAGRMWVLALPPERVNSGAPSEYGSQLDELASSVAGYLTDGEAARDCVDRAVTSGRPRVELFPPLAIDRTCPRCWPPGPGGESVPPEAAQLRLWRSILDGSDVPWSFAAGRLRDADWTGRPWPAWSGDPAVREAVGEAATARWTAADQDRTARALLATAPPARTATARAVLVSGYDLKFARQLAARLGDRTDLAVTVDEWAGLAEPGRRTRDRLAGARSILAEWARPSAVWFARHKRPGQFLAVRLHRYELDRPYPRQIDIDRVDAVVYVSPPIGRRIRAELGWPAEKLVYIPNLVDLGWLDRPKLPGARFGIGLVGMEFANKRLDLALDVVAAVRREDPRFTLMVRSVLPWHGQYAWDRPDEREFVGWCLERIERDPLLRGGVTFDPPGADMARWYRRVGHVLSTSDIESFHLAAADGMASGAVPVIRPWPGAAEIYGSEWVYGSVAEAAGAILAARDADVWAGRSARARERIRVMADPDAVVAAWADLLNGDLDAARRAFDLQDPRDHEVGDADRRRS